MSSEDTAAFVQRPESDGDSDPSVRPCDKDKQPVKTTVRTRGWKKCVRLPNNWSAQKGALVNTKRDTMVWIPPRTIPVIRGRAEVDFPTTSTVIKHVDVMFRLSAKHHHAIGFDTGVAGDPPAAMIFPLNLFDASESDESQPLYGVLVPNTQYVEGEFMYAFKLGTANEIVTDGLFAARELQGAGADLPTLIELPIPMNFRGLAHRVDPTLSSFCYDPSLLVYQHHINKYDDLQARYESRIEAGHFAGVTDENFAASVKMSIEEVRRSPYMAAPKWSAPQGRAQILVPFKSSTTGELSGALVLDALDTDKPNMPYYKIRAVLAPGHIYTDARLVTRRPHHWIRVISGHEEEA